MNTPAKSCRNGAFLTFLGLLLLLAGCATKKSEVATTLGYGRSSKASAGPYQLHYGIDGTNEFMLVAKGNYNVVSEDSDGTDVYLDGLPFLHFERRPDGSLAKLSVDFRREDGNRTISMVDTNADGEWDVKIDHVLRKVFVREGNQWVERKPGQHGTASDERSVGPPSNSDGAGAGRRP